jgi:hypothetical protein
VKAEPVEGSGRPVREFLAHLRVRRVAILGLRGFGLPSLDSVVLVVNETMVSAGLQVASQRGGRSLEQMTPVSLSKRGAPT